MGEDIEPIEVIRTVVRAFEALGVPYAVGGSWASSIYGEPRFTRDADISVAPFAGREQLVADQFGGDYYLSVDAARAANRDFSSFNIIHTPTAYKVDVFVARHGGFEESVLSRRTAATTAETPNEPLFWVSPEDIILLKLRWYRLGNAISDRQWSDILGVLRTQAGRLDEAYLDRWAASLRVSDLLARARGEAGVTDQDDSSHTP
jgi:hypothetical protein